MPPPSIALLTDSQHPELSADDRPLVEAFRASGCTVAAAVWSDPVPTADLALIRSTWDYTSRAAEFLRTLEALATRMQLWNPIDTIRWNADKRYLLELGARGVAVPASTVVVAGNTLPLDAVSQALGSHEVVIKPVVGASGVDTWRATAADADRWHRSVQHRDLLVQAFVPEVVSEGEWSLIFVAGNYSHAVLKRAAAGEFRVQEQHGGRVLRCDPPPAVLRGAERVLDACGHPWIYARVDGVLVAGAFVLMELELIEPALFFELAPEAAGKLAKAVLAL